MGEKIGVERTVRVSDSGIVAEIIDHSEGMDLIGIRFGAWDGEGGVSWADEQHMCLTPELAREVGIHLVELAGYLTPTDTKPAGEGV
jgi:hypothetical protein